MAEKMRAASEGGAAAASADTAGFEAARQRVRRAVVVGDRGLGEPLESDARQRAHRPARRRDAGQDLRSESLVFGHERSRRGAAEDGRRPAAVGPVERRAQVPCGVQRLGGAAPAHAREQHRDARCLDARRRRLRQGAERARRKGREARVLARDAGALGRDREYDAARDAALGGVPEDAARDPQGLDRPPARPARARRILQRDVRLSDAGRARRRPQDRDRAAPRAARPEARAPRPQAPARPVARKRRSGKRQEATP